MTSKKETANKGTRVKKPAVSLEKALSGHKSKTTARVIQLIKRKGFCGLRDSQTEEALCQAILASLLPAGTTGTKSLSTLTHNVYDALRSLVDGECSRIGRLGKNGAKSDPEGDILVLCARITEGMWFITRYGGWTAAGLRDRANTTVPKSHLQRFQKVLSTMLGQVMPASEEEEALNAA